MPWLSLGAGAMSGDAFLHQLPHAFGGGHSHSHDHHESHGHHDHSHSDSPSHSHSIQDLSVGLSVLGDEVLTWQQQKSVKKSDLAPAGRKEDSVMLVKSQRVI